MNIECQSKNQGFNVKLRTLFMLRPRVFSPGNTFVDPDELMFDDACKIIRACRFQTPGFIKQCWAGEEKINSRLELAFSCVGFSATRTWAGIQADVQMYRCTGLQEFENHKSWPTGPVMSFMVFRSNEKRPPKGPLLICQFDENTRQPVFFGLFRRDPASRCRTAIQQPVPARLLQSRSCRQNRISG
mgnify:FL=1